MEPTYQNYLGVLLAVPLGTFTLALLIFTFLTRRMHWFILKNVLGIQPRNGEQEEEEKIDVEQTKSFLTDDTGNHGENQMFPCIIRFFADIFAATIFAVFSLIIFESHILATDIVLVNGKCPNYDAHCFGRYDDSEHSDPPICRADQYANFPMTSSRLRCFGWIYRQMNTREILNLIGAYTLLFIAVSLIVPLVYYLSFYRKQIWWISLVCVIVPFLPITCLIFALSWMTPMTMSPYTILFFSLFIISAWIGWIYAVISSCKNHSI